MTTSRLQNGVDTFVFERYPTTNHSNITYLYARTLAGWSARAFVYFGMPFPRGVTILSARLKMYTSAAVTGTVSLQVARIASSWSANRITWAAQPAPTGTTTSLSKSNPIVGTEWNFDVTAMMQTVSNGSQFYGFRIINTANTLGVLASTQHPTLALRPTLEITWSDVPKAPTQLYPSSGRAVATNKPTLQCNFTDLSGDTTMAGIQVQINSTDVWTAPTFDSGDVPTSVPELDLATTAYAGIASGATVFWRVRVKDGAGLWSPWSASTSMSYQTPATLTVNNPSFGEVDRNYIKNPRAGSVISGFATSAGTGGAATGSRVATGGPLVESPTFYRATITTAPTGGNPYIITGATVANTYATAAVPGEVWSFNFWMRSSFAGTWQARVYFYTSAGAGAGTSVLGPTKELLVDDWTELTIEGVTIPATAAFVRVAAHFASGTLPVINDTIDMSAVLGIKGAVIPVDIRYWDGAMTNTSDEEYVWSGTAHASDSILRRAWVEDATPIIDWTVGGGRTQAAYEVFVQSVNTGLASNYNYTSVRTLWTSGKVMGSATSVSIPAGVLFAYDRTYRVIVRIWDTVVREAVPGFPNYVQVSRLFTLKWSATVGAATLVTATPDPVYPWVILTWNRSLMPDKWNIYRNGKLLTVQNGDFFFVSGNSYRAIDRSAPLRQESTWQVVPVVNGRGSLNNTIVSATAKTRTTLLTDGDGTDPLLIWNADRPFTRDDDATVFEPVGNAPPVVIFSASKNGARGSVKGVVSPTTQSRTSTQIRASFDALTMIKGKTLLLTMVDETMEVFILNPVLIPRIGDGGVIFDISFDFYQTDI